jgi:hypothetical protein
LDNIYDYVDEDAPCRDCDWYNDGYVSDGGEMFHEFCCTKGCCLNCAWLNDFDCFEKSE